MLDANSTLTAVRSDQIHRRAGGEFLIDIKGFTLSSGRVPVDLGKWSVPSGTRPLAAMLPGSADRARFVIGEVQTKGDETTLVLFGSPGFEADTLIF